MKDSLSTHAGSQWRQLCRRYGFDLVDVARHARLPAGTRAAAQAKPNPEAGMKLQTLGYVGRLVGLIAVIWFVAFALGAADMPAWTHLPTLFTGLILLIAILVSCMQEE